MRSLLTVDEEASLIGREKREVDIRAPSRGDECEASCDAGGMVDEHQAKCNKKTCRFACVEKFQAK
jgi:hypothetical protein